MSDKEAKKYDDLGIEFEEELVEEEEVKIKASRIRNELRVIKGNLEVKGKLRIKEKHKLQIEFMKNSMIQSAELGEDNPRLNYRELDIEEAEKFDVAFFVKEKYLDVLIEDGKEKKVNVKVLEEDDTFTELTEVFSDKFLRYNKVIKSEDDKKKKQKK